jgi:hypothetical protein
MAGTDTGVICRQSSMVTPGGLPGRPHSVLAWVFTVAPSPGIAARSRIGPSRPARTGVPSQQQTGPGPGPRPGMPDASALSAVLGAAGRADPAQPATSTLVAGAGIYYFK